MKTSLSQSDAPELPGSGPAARAWRALERGADRICGERDNPLRQLGGLGFALFWLISVSGAWLYVGYETSVDGAWASVQWLTHEQWWGGGLMRSLHRYASDALVLVVVLHLLREISFGRFRGFRWYSWVSGVPTLWLIAAAGAGGYWLVWDTVAQFVATASTEWFGALPGFGPSLVRNFVADEAMTDRLFSLLLFLHIGLALVLLLAMWAHVQRLTRPRTFTSRPVALWTLIALLALSLGWPAVSEAPANLARVPDGVPIDWFYLAPLPAIYAATPGVVWFVVTGLTVLLGVAPWLGRSPRPQAAQVDPAHCNGCERCFADCPYAAIAMAPHPGGRGRIAVVDEDRCAACGICAGACPSANPFRRGERLISGIDLPWLTVGQLRDDFDAALERHQREAVRGAPTATSARRLPELAPAAPPRLPGLAPAAPLVVIVCRHGAGLGAAVPADVLAFELPCAGMLPPSFVDYALRRGARGVVVAACPPEDCEFRFGASWTAMRMAGEREPRLRASVPRDRVRVIRAAREERQALVAAIAAFDAANTGFDVTNPGVDATIAGVDATDTGFDTRAATTGPAPHPENEHD